MKFQNEIMETSVKIIDIIQNAAAETTDDDQEQLIFALNICYNLFNSLQDVAMKSEILTEIQVNND